MGEVKDGKYDGKGLYFDKEQNKWELNEYKDGESVNPIKSGEGRP